MIKIDVEKNNGNVEVTLNISKEKWQNILKAAKKELAENLEVKGFRKGNVPKNIADQNISKQDIETKAVDKALDKHYAEAMDKIKDEKIVSRPEIHVEKITDNEGIIKIITALFPKVELGDYKKIKVKYEPSKVTEDELKAELKQTEQFFETIKKIEDKNHNISNGDIVNIDFNGFLEGKEFEGGKAEGFDLEIGSKSFIDNFEEQLIGLKINDEKTIKVKFPKEYPSEELKGKEVEFKVKINFISTKLKAVGKELEEKLKQLNLNSEQDLKIRINSMLEDKKIQEYNDKFFRNFVEEIKKLEDSIFTVPDKLLEQEINQEFKSFKEKLTQQGMKFEDYLLMLQTTEEDFKKNNLKVAAKNRVIDGLIYSTLIEDMKIVLSDDDFIKEYENVAKAQNMTLKEVETQLTKEMISNSLLFKKLIENIKK